MTEYLTKEAWDKLSRFSCEVKVLEGEQIVHRIPLLKGREEVGTLMLAFPKGQATSDMSLSIKVNNKAATLPRLYLLTKPQNIELGVDGKGNTFFGIPVRSSYRHMGHLIFRPVEGSEYPVFLGFRTRRGVFQPWGCMPQMYVPQALYALDLGLSLGNNRGYVISREGRVASFFEGNAPETVLSKADRMRAIKEKRMAHYRSRDERC